MKTIGIARIEITNPLLASYTKTIKSWDAAQSFDVENRDFYAVYFNGLFLAASTMDYDANKSNVDILLLNGSNSNYDTIQEESTKHLTDIALAEYGAKTVNVNYVKRIERKNVRGI